MITISVVLGLIVLVFFVGYLIFSNSIKKREKLCKEWKVGDKLILNSFELGLQLNKHNKEFGILVGCNPENVIIQIGDNFYCRNWYVIKHNKSYEWREHYEKCKIAMGTEPSFNPIINDNNKSSSNSSGMIDGKPVELLTEVECQIYLKQSLEEENFELAEKIRKQMQKFR